MKLTQNAAHGLKSLSQTDLFQTEKSTNEASVMCSQATFVDLSSVTGSLEFADGVLPSDLPDGQTTSLSGRAVAHASRLALLDEDFKRLTKDTCGLISETSSASADLQKSLESRLRAQMDVNGSPEYRLTWKHWLIGSRRLICALRASKRRIQDKDFTGWPTPMSVPTSKASHGSTSLQERTAYKKIFSGWATPDAGVMNLNETVESVMARRKICKKKHGNNGFGLRLQTESKMVVGWCSPTAQDGTRGGRPPRPHDTGVPLSQQAAQVSGTVSTSSTFPMENRGALRPGHSRWLQGYPKEWCRAAIVALRKLKTRRSSASQGSVATGTP
jgi:hypothetical protein